MLFLEGHWWKDLGDTFDFYEYDYQTYICPEAVFEQDNDWLPDCEIKTGGNFFWRQLDWSLPRDAAAGKQELGLTPPERVETFSDAKSALCTLLFSVQYCAHILFLKHRFWAFKRVYMKGLGDSGVLEKVLKRLSDPFPKANVRMWYQYHKIKFS